MKIQEFKYVLFFTTNVIFKYLKKKNKNFFLKHIF